MTIRRFAIVVFLCFVPIVGFLTLTVIQASISHRYHPDPKRRSSFLRNYNPLAVVKPFAAKDSPMFSSSDGIGGAAGERFVRNNRNVSADFTIPTEMRFALLHALSEDLIAELKRNGATILESGGDATGGFQVKYRVETSTGTAKVLPLLQGGPLSQALRCERGIENIRAHVDVKEKWYPNEAATAQPSVEAW